MTTATKPAPVPAGPTTALRPSLKVPVSLGVLSLVALVFFGFLGPSKTAEMKVSEQGDAMELPAILIPGQGGGIALAILLLAMAAYSVYLWSKGERSPKWLPIAFAVVFVFALLVWIVAGAREPSISLAGLIAGSVTLAVPLVFGSLSGVLCERVGVVNIAIEGQLLGGAFTAALVATVTHNAYVGLLAAAAAGALVSMVLAVFSIKYLVNQIIVGVVLNVLVSGLTGFLFGTVMARTRNCSTHRPGWTSCPSRSCPTSRSSDRSCSSSRWPAT